VSAGTPWVDADEVRRRLDDIDYLVDDGMATALFLAMTLEQPLPPRPSPARWAPPSSGCSATRD